MDDANIQHSSFQALVSRQWVPVPKLSLPLALEFSRNSQTAQRRVVIITFTYTKLLSKLGLQPDLLVQPSNMPRDTTSHFDGMEAGSESSLYSAWKPAEEIAFWKACIKYGGKAGYTNKSSLQIIKAMTQVHSKSSSTYSSKWYRMRKDKAMCETLFGVLRGGYWDRKNHQMRARDPRAEKSFIEVSLKSLGCTKAKILYHLVQK